MDFKTISLEFSPITDSRLAKVKKYKEHELSAIQGALERYSGRYAKRVPMPVMPTPAQLKKMDSLLSFEEREVNAGEIVFLLWNALLIIENQHRRLLDARTYAGRAFCHAHAKYMESKPPLNRPHSNAFEARMFQALDLEEVYSNPIYRPEYDDADR